LAFGLSKIFATSTATNSDAGNSETNIGVYDNFVNSCFSTYRDVMKKVSFNQEMSEQRELALACTNVVSDHF
jgi:predicted sulfurtransferase